MGNLKEGKERITAIVKAGYKEKLRKLAEIEGKKLATLSGEILMRQIGYLEAVFTKSIPVTERVGEQDSERVDKRVEFMPQKSEK